MATSVNYRLFVSQANSRREATATQARNEVSLGRIHVNDGHRCGAHTNSNLCSCSCVCVFYSKSVSSWLDFSTWGCEVEGEARVANS